MADPISRFRRWFRDAVRAVPRLPDAVALATSTRGGRPSVRFVLLKGADARGFLFFTDERSRKGRELASNPRAALAFHWTALERQVRVEGRVTAATRAESDAYWRTRPLGSRLSASASRQSAPLGSRGDLVRRRDAIERALDGGAPDRPEWWRGYRIVPDALEFWQGLPDRLHHRERFERRRGRWVRKLLQP